MSWKRDKIGNHCEITSSKRIFFSEYVDSGIPFYRSKEIIERYQGQEISEPLYIDENRYNEIKEKYGVPLPGDMLLTSVGTIGIPYIVQKNDLFYFKDGNLTWFRNFDNHLSSRYLAYWIKTTEGYGTLYNTTIGSSQKALTISALNNVEFPLPPIDIQNRIVSILSSYDDLIENNQRQIKLLEEAAQRLYKEWFVDLHFPGYEHTKIIDGVPEGWKQSTVKACSSLLRRGIAPQYNDEGKYRVISQKCIRTPIMSTEEARKQSKDYSSELGLQNSDTVICSTGTGTLGRVGQVYGDYKNTTFDSHVTVVRADIKKVGKQYLYRYLKSQQSFLMGMGRGSTNQQELYKRVIEELSILIPSMSVQDKFEALVQPIHDQIALLVRSTEDLKSVRDCLLPKLMGGEIEV